MPSIPPELLKKFLANPENERCALCGARPIQIHHNFLWGGKSQNLLWALIALCKEHHDLANKREVRMRLDHIMFNRVSNLELKKYSKAMDFVGRKRYLNYYFTKNAKVNGEKYSKINP